ncbi:major facilitator family transporter [Gregarina niphandrodes]|uniref:Major facilitator family transporter n=1 Tax=Gregarina niphandrodes TaxID=110365 RepID=A0A023B385_GRENI|nr:major facilitator family transporter [Gregarina niphandrodes]EZG55354.1 major facilitator family transporter [Gregarina niphandrodes]|eukprot:XP_011131620.1 major facilitator family transporter [Gregarina niphandrodes]
MSRQCDRWLRVVVYGLAVTLTSCLFAGWQQFSLILLKGGAFAWRCTDGVEENAELPGLYTCAVQEKAVNSLLPIASGIELAGGVVAGVALDWVGPRVCAFLGSTIGFLAYTMLVYSSQKHNMYAAALAVSGIAINLIGFPALTLEDYFPSAAATTAAYVIACQCLSSVIPPVMWLLWKHHPGWTFQQLWWGYLLGIWIPISIPYLALLPFKRHRNQAIAQDATQEPFSAKRLLKYLGSLPFVVMNLLSIVLMLQTSYWQMILRSQLGVAISEFLGYTMPTQAVWAIIIGRITDYTKTPFIISVLLLMYSLIYYLVPVGKGNIQYLSVMIFNMAMSYAYTIKYSFVQERFPQKYYGTLVGVSGAIGGGGVLATNLVNYFDRPRTASIILASATFVCLPACLWLHMELKRHRGCSDQPITLKSDVREIVNEHSDLHAHPDCLSAEHCQSASYELQGLLNAGSTERPSPGNPRQSLHDHSGYLEHHQFSHHVNPLEPLCTSPSHLKLDIDPGDGPTPEPAPEPTPEPNHQPMNQSMNSIARDTVDKP